MKIQLLAFGIVQDIINSTSLEMELQEIITVKQFKRLLSDKYPKIKNIQSFAVAVNEEYANDELLIKANDVVALIPPDSGG
ncbi:MAG: MoaD/ThiS family protein [Tenacibaculum sp.]